MVMPPGVVRWGEAGEKGGRRRPGKAAKKKRREEEEKKKREELERGRTPALPSFPSRLSPPPFTRRPRRKSHQGRDLKACTSPLAVA
jgi:hypothetical protein